MNKSVYGIIVLGLLLIHILINLDLFFKSKMSEYTDSNSILDSDTFSSNIAPNKYQDLLGVGIDVDWAKTEKGRKAYNSIDPFNFKERGFSHVRIRVKDNVDTLLLRHLHRIVDDSLKVGLIPILAYQAKDFKMNPNRENMQKAVNWWSTVSKSFKGYSPKLSFDLIIEVTDELNKNPEILNEFYEHTVSEIRKTNPERNIFISPVMRSAPENLHLLKIPSKSNKHLLAEWHMYASGPSKNNQKKIWTTGTETEKELILSKIHSAQLWSQQNRIKTWVGAWMPGDYNRDDSYRISEQVHFASFVAEELKRAKIPFAINSDTKFYDRETHKWIPKMSLILDAILK